MASDDTSGAKPAGPVALRIKLRYDDVDAMVSRFAGNVGRSGLFLPTRSLHPVGTEVKFELRIANDTAVLVGLGKVKAARPPDPANPRATFGLAIELMRVTRDGREIIIRMLERRRELGLPDVAIPLPEDVEAARRMDVETQPGVPTPVKPLDSQPVAESKPIAAEATPTQPRAASEVMPVRPTPPPESLLTAPRAVTGPLGVARGTSERTPAPILAPEPPRAKRPKLADLVAKASELSGPVAALDLGDEPDVDVGKAIVRARMLAAGQLDIELDALRESSAAPIAVDVEAASAELARQLGGKPISKKDRSARWAVPPAVAPAPEPAPPPVIASPPNAETILARPFEPLPDLEPETEVPSRRLPTASGEMDQLAQEAAMAIVGQAGEGVRAIERPADPADAAPVPFLEQPSAPVEATPVEAAPVPFVAEPVVAPPEDEDPELSSFERALDAARIHTGVTAAPAPEDDIEELDSAELEDENGGEHTQVGAIAAFAQGLEEPPLPAAYDPFAHEHPADAGAFQAEEISDLDVLAEADADDDDLLSANGERDSSVYPVIDQPSFAEPPLTPPPDEPAYQQRYEPHAPAYQDPPHYYEPQDPQYSHADYVHDVFTPPPPPEPSPFRPLSPRDDFAARLALDEEDEPPLARHPNAAAAFADPHRASRDSDDDFDEPHNYTQPEDPDYENPEVEFDERHDFGRRGFELADDARSDPDPIEDLDNALSTLDVDLDRLEVPPADRRRAPVRARALPGMPPERARRISDAQPPQKQSTQPLPRATQRPRRPDSDDGVIIDFDDDD